MWGVKGVEYVCVCGCVSQSLCVCLTACVCGCVGQNLCACLTACVCGYVGQSLCVCLTACVCGCVGQSLCVCLPDCVRVWLCRSGEGMCRFVGHITVSHQAALRPSSQATPPLAR